MSLKNLKDNAIVTYVLLENRETGFSLFEAILNSLKSEFLTIEEMLIECIRYSKENEQNIELESTFHDILNIYNRREFLSSELKFKNEVILQFLSTCFNIKILLNSKGEIKEFNKLSENFVCIFEDSNTFHSIKSVQRDSISSGKTRTFRDEKRNDLNISKRRQKCSDPKCDQNKIQGIGKQKKLCTKCNICGKSLRYETDDGKWRCRSYFTKKKQDENK